jgi:DNA-binding response OmpR family regulator
VLTADATQETKRRALSVGARDFLTKPLDRTELLLRVHNLLQVQHLQDQLFDQNANLEHEVAERTRDLEQARLEILDRPDLILLDLHLPDMHGREVLEQLKCDDTTAAIPVVIVSADATSDQVEQLTQAGAMEYQTKPIDIDRLLKTITGSLSAHPSVT